ncbi:MAG: AAA family ATPase, partial [Microscillaceae bacterium]|nr:AAA family ATPase [Microscillaceae bacterium]
MQLSKLEIKGFKSFGEAVKIDFDRGVTGIVGPNGCGKSNIVDSIRWVLGEQFAELALHVVDVLRPRLSLGERMRPVHDRVVHAEAEPLGAAGGVELADDVVDHGKAPRHGDDRADGDDPHRLRQGLSALRIEAVEPEQRLRDHQIALGMAHQPAGLDPPGEQFGQRFHILAEPGKL